MRIIHMLMLCLLCSFVAKAQKIDTTHRKITNSININYNETLRQISTLSDDSLRGRGLFNGGAVMAADFIEKEYQRIGLQSVELPYTSGFRQSLPTVRVGNMSGIVVINNDTIPSHKTLFMSSQEALLWDSSDSVAVEYISSTDDLVTKLRNIETSYTKAIILVDTALAGSFFNKYKARYHKKRRLEDSTLLSKSSYVMVLGNIDSVQSYSVKGNATIKAHSVDNLVGMIEGKSLKDEYIIFSAHYDNVGYVAVNKKDSIANGADENASGVTAVLQLAQHFKDKGDNERSILFVNYGAEDINSMTSKFFANNIEAEKVIAVINIDAIGKESVFGSRSAFITGYNKDNLGKYFTKKSSEIKFKFKSDPYTNHNLFYRAANTPLGILGVPSHTFSTIRIDKDRYLGSARDDMNTIELENMIEVIKGIAFASEDLINGSFTPARVIDFKDNPSERKQKK